MTHPFELLTNDNLITTLRKDTGSTLVAKMGSKEDAIDFLRARIRLLIMDNKQLPRRERDPSDLTFLSTLVGEVYAF